MMAPQKYAGLIASVKFSVAFLLSMAAFALVIAMETDQTVRCLLAASSIAGSYVVAWFLTDWRNTNIRARRLFGARAGTSND
jgi:hypothetical protein